jgi:hypothetical protein
LGDGSGNATANFVSGFIPSLPPLQEIAAMAGVKLPEYLGKVVPEHVNTITTEELISEEVHADKLIDEEVED